MQESTEAPRLPYSDRAEMNDIIDHVRAGLDEDEQAARDASRKRTRRPHKGSGARWSRYVEGGDDGWAIESEDGEHGFIVGWPEALAVHIARHDPARTLAEVEVIRQVINDYCMADRACMDGDAGSPEYATIRAGRDAFKSVLKAYARASGWQPSA